MVRIDRSYANVFAGRRAAGEGVSGWAAAGTVKLPREEVDDELPRGLDDEGTARFVHGCFVRPYLKKAGGRGHRQLHTSQKQYLQYRVVLDLARLRRWGNSVGPLTYEVALQFLSWFGQIDRSMQLLAEMKAAGLMPTAASYEWLLHCHAARGDLPGWVRTRRAMRNAGFPPRLAAYNSYLYCLAVAAGPAAAVGGHPVETLARRVYEALKQDGCPPDQVTLRGLLSNCRSHRAGAAVVRAFEVHHGIKANAESRMKLLVTCRWQGEVEQAKEVHQALLDDGVNSSALWNCLLRVLKEAADWPAVRAAAERMGRLGTTPDLMTYTLVFEAIAKAVGAVAPGSADGGELVAVAELQFSQAEASGFATERFLFDGLSGVYAAAGLRRRLAALEEKQAKQGIGASDAFRRNVAACHAAVRPLGPIPRDTGRGIPDMADAAAAAAPGAAAAAAAAARDAGRGIPDLAEAAAAAPGAAAAAAAAAAEGATRAPDVAPREARLLASVRKPSFATGNPRGAEDVNSLLARSAGIPPPATVAPAAAAAPPAPAKPLLSSVLFPNHSHNVQDAAVLHLKSPAAKLRRTLPPPKPPLSQKAARARLLSAVITAIRRA
ncbi:Pentatricopeptide repeat-containing protein [Diplonema papillatum]|nr:Pentatricopeptide repeat-containing protein [Diplonema papillatum]